MFKELFGAFRGGIMQGRVINVLSKTFDMSVTHPSHLEKIKENISWAPEDNEFEHAIGFLAGFVPTIQKNHPLAHREVLKYVSHTRRLYLDGLARNKLPGLVLFRNAVSSFGIEAEIPDSWWLEKSEQPLNRCSSFIDIAGPDFGDDFRAVFTVRTADLVGWLLLSGDEAGGTDAGAEATRQGLLYWARRFEESDEGNTKAPKSVHRLLQDSLTTMLDSSVGFYTCLECGKVFDWFQKTEENRRQEGGWTRWLEVWKCENGHVVHMKQNGVRFTKGTGY